MNTPTVLLNSLEIKNLTGVGSSKLKYHRNSGHLKGYQITNQRQWFYRADQINKLFVEHLQTNGQNVPKLDIIKTTINTTGGNQG